MLNQNDSRYARILASTSPTLNSFYSWSTFLNERLFLLDNKKVTTEMTQLSERYEHFIIVSACLFTIGVKRKLINYDDYIY